MPMEKKPKELVVISGKGGTGKTSIVASFAALAKQVVLADCDVDAADLHLILEPEILRRENFSGGKRAWIDPERCTACRRCQDLCRFDAVSFDGPGNTSLEKTFRVDPIACEGCGVCVWFCSEHAIEFAPAINGEWYVSETRLGAMVHAKLGTAEENSGKLVSLVRKEATAIATNRNIGLVLIDGSPGIGCPVIASLSGADLALIVTEPTLSGLHDMGRVADVARHFGTRGLLCVNKWDLNSDMTETLEQEAERLGLSLVGRVRYDRAITEAQLRRQTVVEYQRNGCASDIKEVWSKVASDLSS